MHIAVVVRMLLRVEPMVRGMGEWRMGVWRMGVWRMGVWKWEYGEWGCGKWEYREWGNGEWNSRQGEWCYHRRPVQSKYPFVEDPLMVMMGVRLVRRWMRGTAAWGRGLRPRLSR